jgi:hypothetical protein
LANDRREDSAPLSVRHLSFERTIVPSTTASLGKGLFRWLAPIFSACLASVAPAQTMSPSAAPVEWLRYAQSATAAVTGWLEADEEAAARLRAYLHQTRLAPDEPKPPLELKLWIAPDGLVSRVDFTPFIHEAANVDLRAVIAGRRLPGPPPRDMLQPLRLAVQLEVEPAEASALDDQYGRIFAVHKTERPVFSP